MNLVYFILSVIFLVIFNVLVVSAPFGIIWLVNYLFPMFSIPYSFLSWIVVVLINFGFFSVGLIKIKEKL